MNQNIFITKLVTKSSTYCVNYLEYCVLLQTVSF